MPMQFMAFVYIPALGETMLAMVTHFVSLTIFCIKLSAYVINLIFFSIAQYCLKNMSCRFDN